MADRRFLAVSAGDPAGVGPLLLGRIDWARILNPTTIVIICGPRDLRSALVARGLNCADLPYEISRAIAALTFTPSGDLNTAPFPPTSSRDEDLFSFFNSDTLGTHNIFWCDLSVAPNETPAEIAYGQSGAAAGRQAFIWFRLACALVHIADPGRRRVALLTQPVSKADICQAGVDFAGHTGALASWFARDAVMVLANAFGATSSTTREAMRVVPLTGHIPLEKVAERVRAFGGDDILRQLTHFQSELGISADLPVAVLGLNPHAGEAGTIGVEELGPIEAFIEKLRRSGLPARGPYAADGFFGSGAWRSHSVTLGWYHDQVLIPFKFHAGYEGINVSLGLGFLRLSPDHGSAANLADPRRADGSGAELCLRAALDWLQLV